MVVNGVILMIYVNYLLATLAKSSNDNDTTLSYSELESNFSITTDIMSSTDVSISNMRCDNGTCLTVTTSQPISSSTTLQPNVTKENPVIIIPNNDICSCNLMPGVCDIDCCCDIDCSFENKLVFDHCEIEENAHIDTNACKYNDFEFFNLSIQEREVQNNDLFCVIHSNLPPSYIVQKKQPLKSFKEAVLEKVDKYSFLRDVIDKLPYDNFINVSQPYVSGKSLWIIRNLAVIESFKLKQDYITKGCNIEIPIEYLRNVNNKCIHTVVIDNKFLNAAHYYKNISFLSTPTLFNLTKFKNKTHWVCPKSLCVRVVPKICSNIYLDDCENLYDNTTRTLKCVENINSRIISCYNTVKALKYVIYHNGIKGLTEVEVYLHLRNVSFRNDEIYKYEQYITTEFLWFNTSVNASNTFSGNPGYLIGKPILMGKFFNGTVHRNSRNYSGTFMTLPFEDEKVCYIGKNLYQPVEFGYNIILDCIITEEFNSTGLNASQICKNIQIQVFKYWSIEISNYTEVNLTVGQFGNANSKVVDDWISILYKISPKNILENISGVFNKDNTTITCNNITSGLYTDVFHARIDLKRLKNQEKILGVTYEFHPLYNITFSAESESSKFTFNLELSTQVTFYDITIHKFRKAVEPPSLQIRLPYDFFYPFIKIGNDCACSKISLYWVIIISVSISFLH